MNIFEDLLDELKEENLLEKTVSETNKPSSSNSGGGKGNESELFSENNFEQSSASKHSAGAANESTTEKPFFTASEPAKIKADFYRKRAVEEVSGLQMVEHVFCGVERQQKKNAPKVYDDLNVKKALHAFLQISGDPEKPEHAQAEFQLMQETEAWYSALSHRDKQISIAHLRRYCETTRPVLSSQALVALARFYRNSPYSEAVRSKFDLIVTRLFTRELDGEKRELVFDRDSLMRHLSELYAEWESISIYSDSEEENESELLLAALKFEELMSEAESAANFDELVRNDFFNRLRTFKQGTNEKFFAPLVTATAVESNVRIGNRYIELLELEKAKGDLEKLENKYGFLHDQIISDATSKTLQLVELLKNKSPEPEAAPQAKPKKAEKVSAVKVSAVETSKPAEKTSPKIESQPIVSAGKRFAVNKWLLGGSLAAVILSGAIYLRSGVGSPPEFAAQDVKTVNLDNSSLNEFVRDARIGNRAFFAVVKPSWDALNREKKEEILNKIMSIGNDKNFKRVQLISPSGKMVGTVADGIVEINN